MLKSIGRFFRKGAGATSQQFARMIGFSSRSATGLPITYDTALCSTAVFACIRVLSEDVAKLPLELKRKRPRGGFDVVTDHPVARLIEQPNGWQTDHEFRQMMQTHLCWRGNGIAVILRNGRGEPVELIPVHPDAVVIHATGDGSLFYGISRKNLHEQGVLSAAPMMVPYEDILHMRWMTLDGLHGISPIDYAREAVGLSLAAEKHGAASFGNAGMPAGVLKHPETLSDEAALRFRQQWQELYGGVNRTGKTAILEEGMTFEAINFNNEQSQFLETRRFQVEEVCRMFRMPPHMIGDLARSTNNNIEHQGLEYTTNTLMPWLGLWESAMRRDLLTDEERAQGMFFEFDDRRLLRGDVKSRFDAYAVGRNNGILSANEARIWEGLNPVEGGDELLRPLNMDVMGEVSRQAVRAILAEQMKRPALLPGGAEGVETEGEGQ